MGAIQLRPYQTELVDQARANMKMGHKSVLIHLPTGGGKTCIAAFMLKTAREKGLLAYFMCHRRELITQTVRTLSDFDVPCGTIAASHPSDPSQLVQVCSVPTVARRLSKIPAPSLIFWDECQFIGAKTWTAIYKNFPDSYHVLLSATPQRNDSTALGDYASIMIKGPSMRSLIDDGFLSDYRLFAPTNVSLAGVRTSMDDYNKTQLSQLMDKPTITGSAITEYLKVAKGKRAAVFCASVKHSENVAAEFNQAGIPAMHVDGETPPHIRDQAVRDFAAGKLLALMNVDLFGVGFDLPAMECAILLRPTQSESLYLQQVGRALRVSPGKTHAIILDHVGNCTRHGLPDEDREWSLLGRAARSKSKSDENTSVRICKNCFAAQLPGNGFCKYCKVEFEKMPRKVEEVEGTLEEIKARKIKMQVRQTQGRAQSLEELIQLGKSRGYKKAERWAKHIYQARQRKRMGK